MKKYILNGKEPVECDDTIEWGKWFGEGSNRIVKQETVNDSFVSTIFMGLDHAFNGGVPVLFETIVFNGKHDQYSERYYDWDEAEAGHKRIVEMIKTS